MATRDLEIVQLVRELATRMIKGEQYSADAVQKEIEDLGNEIQRFGRNNAFVDNE